MISIYILKMKINIYKHNFKMGHIIKKKTKFQKGNFVLNRNELYVFGSMNGYYLPSKVYQHHMLPYWFSDKITVMEKMHWKFQERRSILNWLA